MEARWTNTFCNFDKYMSWFRHIQSPIFCGLQFFSEWQGQARWTNTSGNLDKYILRFRQIHFAIFCGLQYFLEWQGLGWRGRVGRDDKIHFMIWTNTTCHSEKYILKSCRLQYFLEWQGPGWRGRVGRDVSTKGDLALLQSQHPPMKCSNILLVVASFIGSNNITVDRQIWSYSEL